MKRIVRAAAVTCLALCSFSGQVQAKAKGLKSVKKLVLCGVDGLRSVALMNGDTLNAVGALNLSYVEFVKQLTAAGAEVVDAAEVNAAISSVEGARAARSKATMDEAAEKQEVQMNATMQGVTAGMADAQEKARREAN